MILRNANNNDFEAVRKLYRKAFPLEERAPFYFLKRKVLQERAQMLIADEEGKFAGFMYVITFKDMAYLLFFAVTSEKRGSGYGSRMMQLLKDMYPDKRIFLAREMLDENSGNYEQRVRRRNFYLKNEFEDWPLRMREFVMLYDVMGMGERISSEEFGELIAHWSNRFIKKMVSMTGIE